MSVASQLRKKVNYEKDVPRCETCASYRKPYIFLKRDSLPIRSRPWCKTSDFWVAPMSCCDLWHRAGEVIAHSAPTVNPFQTWARPDRVHSGQDGVSAPLAGGSALKKRKHEELLLRAKPTTPAELEELTTWYFGKPLHLSLLRVHGPWKSSDAAGAQYEVAEPYKSYHGKGWLHTEYCIKGYDYSARFWEYVIGPLTCGGIAGRSYGQAHVNKEEDAERLRALAKALGHEAR